MRLIDADALQNILLPIANALEHEYGNLGGAVSGCMKHIDNAPTIDAVPVVRCRECKHGELDFLADNGTTHIECYKCIHPTTGLKIMEPYDFCSYGERKEGAD